LKIRRGTAHHGAGELDEIDPMAEAVLDLFIAGIGKGYTPYANPRHGRACPAIHAFVCAGRVCPGLRHAEAASAAQAGPAPGAWRISRAKSL